MSSALAILANDAPPGVANEAEDILAGLSKPQKQVSPNYFYNQRGSELFPLIPTATTASG